MFILIPLGIAIVIALVVMYHAQERARREAIAAWASSHGLSFTADRQHGLGDAFPFECLSKGHSRYAYNVAAGTRHDQPTWAFDYHYATTSRDSKGRSTTHHHHFSMVIIRTGLPLQPITIRPEHLGDKMLAFFGGGDINFESGEFSRAFHVKADDRRWAFDFVQPATMELLLASPRMNIQVADAFLAAYRSSRFSADDFDAALRLLDGVLDRLPNYLHREWKGA